MFSPEDERIAELCGYLVEDDRGDLVPTHYGRAYTRIIQISEMITTITHEEREPTIIELQYIARSLYCAQRDVTIYALQRTSKI